MSVEGFVSLEGEAPNLILSEWPADRLSAVDWEALSATTVLPVVDFVPKDLDWSVDVSGLEGQPSAPGRGNGVTWEVMQDSGGPGGLGHTRHPKLCGLCGCDRGAV